MLTVTLQPDPLPPRLDSQGSLQGQCSSRPALPGDPGCSRGDEGTRRGGVGNWHVCAHVCVGRSLSRQKQCVKMVGNVGWFSAAVCKLHANETVCLQVQRSSVVGPVGPASWPHSERSPSEAGWADGHGRAPQELAGVRLGPGRLAATCLALALSGG